MDNAMWEIWELFVCISEVMCMWLLFTKRLDCSRIKKYISLATVPVLCAAMLICRHFDIPQFVIYVTVFAIDFIVALIFFRGKIKERLLWSLMHAYILCLCDSVAMTVMSASPEKLAFVAAPGVTRFLVRGAYGLLCFAFTMLILRLTEKVPLRPSIMNWMSLFCAISVVVLCSKSVFMSGEPQGTNVFSYVITGFAILAVVVVIPLVFILLNNSIDEQSKTETEKAVMEREFKYLEQLSSLAIKVREIKHDYANHLSVMVNLASGGNIEELLKYIESYKDEYGIVDLYAITGDLAVDALLSAKFIICRNNAIRVDYQLFKWGKTELTSEELCSLFGNILDNAIEACRGVAEEKRYINIKTSRVSSMLNICVENSYDEQSKRPERTGEHGFGLPRIRSIAEKHNGVCTIDKDGQVFRTDILLPIV